MIKVYSKNRIYWFKSREEAAPIMRADPGAAIIEFRIYWQADNREWRVIS
jgi:hypothetical protein